jgi:hypothetical protein
MNTDEFINATYSAVPCLGCSRWESDKVKALLGWFFLTYECDGPTAEIDARAIVGRLLQAAAAQCAGDRRYAVVATEINAPAELVGRDLVLCWRA